MALWFIVASSHSYGEKIRGTYNLDFANLKWLKSFSRIKFIQIETQKSRPEMSNRGRGRYL